MRNLFGQKQAGRDFLPEMAARRGGVVAADSLVRAAALVVAAAALLSAGGAGAVWLELPKTGVKCVSDEIQANVVVLADYAVMYDDLNHDPPKISAKVTSPYGNTLHHNENVTIGQFAFTTSESGNYLACFWVEGNQQNVGVSVNIDWRIGIAAKDWASVAKKEKIEGVELELRKLEGIVEALHGNLLYFKAREAEMREVSEKTNARVAWLSIVSLGVCICVSVLQLWHLKTYFRKKKLI